MNEAFKRRYSDVLTESVDLSCKEKLRKELKDAAMQATLDARGLDLMTKYKKIEIALQAVLERNFPDNLWWEVTNCQIFWDLMEHQNASLTCDNIIDRLNPGFCDDELEEAVSLREDNSIKIIKEQYVYLPTPDGKADIHVMLIEESFDDETEYGIDIDWGSASKISDKISKAIWKYSHGDDRYIHIGENCVEISQKGFVESLCCWNDEDLDVIEELYDAVIEGLIHIDVPEDLEEAVSNPERTISKVDKNLAKEVDKDLVRDLTLILENEGEVYRRSIVPVINNLKKKKAKGQFDEKLAIQAFFHVVEGALKQPWFYRYYSYSIATVSVPERYAVAKELLDGFMEEIEFEDTSKHENLSISKIRK